MVLHAFSGGTYQRSTDAERAVFYVCLSICLLNLPLIAYALLNRSFPPIRTRCVWMTCLVGLSGSLFSIAFNLSIGLLGYSGPLSHCFGWAGWALVVAGLGPFMSLVVGRLVMLYRAAIAKCAAHFVHFAPKKFMNAVWPPFVLWLPALAIGISGQVLPRHMTTDLVVVGSPSVCAFSNAYIYWVYAYFGALVVVAASLCFALRRVSEAFKEFRVTLCALAFFAALIAADVSVIATGNLKHSVARILLAVFNTLLINAYFWLLLVPPMFRHILHSRLFRSHFTSIMSLDDSQSEQLKIRTQGGSIDGCMSRIRQKMFGTSEEAETFVALDLNVVEASGNQEYSPAHSAIEVLQRSTELSQPHTGCNYPQDDISYGSTRQIL